MPVISKAATRSAALSSAAYPDAGAGTDPSKPDFLTIAEVARLLRVSERTVRRRIEDGTICKAPMSGRLVRIGAGELTRLAEWQLAQGK